MNFFESITEEEKKPKVTEVTKITPRPIRPKLTKEQFRSFLDKTLTIESFEALVKQEKTSGAEVLNVKLNPKGKNPAYNRRNKRRYSVTFKATLEIAKELLVENFERLNQ